MLISHPNVSVVIPAMNEAENLPHVARRMPQGIAEIILVDGNSRDRTVDVARELWPDVRVVNQTRKGKGNALACGFLAARGDIIVMVDADGSTDVGEIPTFVDALTAGADFAKGTRFAYRGGSSDITHLRRMGNYALNSIVNSLYDTKFTDLCYGYNAFWRHCLPHIGLPEPTLEDAQWGDGFEVETLMNIRAARANLKIVEIASFERDRIYGESNLNSLTDGTRVLRTIVAERRRTDSLVVDRLHPGTAATARTAGRMSGPRAKLARAIGGPHVRVEYAGPELSGSGSGPARPQ
ncbi:MAG: glycosyltransferase family 2 protein [Gordonia sp. (in: high G+C Gram-positive bacteria)]